jgi:hypothetical protein
MQTSVQVRISGVSALLMHAYPMAPPEHLDKLPPEEQVKAHLYTHNGGAIHIPSEAIRRALVAGAGYSKGKGRATLAKNAAAAILVEPEDCTLTPQKYTIDSRPVVIPATRGRIVRHRARWDAWQVSFRILHLPELVTTSQLRRILDDTGQLVGILDYRPERKGPYGRFTVDLFSAD